MIFHPYIYIDITVTIARSLLAITMPLTYPMEQFVARQCILTIFNRLIQNNNTNNACHEYKDMIHINNNDVNISNHKTENISNYTSIDNVIIQYSDLPDNEKNLNIPDQDTNEVKAFEVEVEVSNSIKDGIESNINTRINNIIQSNNLSRYVYYLLYIKEVDPTGIRLRICLTLFLWSTSISLAMTVKDLGVILSFTGIIIYCDVNNTGYSNFYFKHYMSYSVPYIVLYIIIYIVYTRLYSSINIRIYITIFNIFQIK